MDFIPLLHDKQLKAKQITEMLSSGLCARNFEPNALIQHAVKAKEPVQANIMEALVHATSEFPDLATPEMLHFILLGLTAKAPRLRWESARLVIVFAKRYPNHVETCIEPLLLNARHTGTVVRWSAAQALCAIVSENEDLRSDLIPALEVICMQEEKNSIRKIYQTTFKNLIKK